MLSHNKFMRQRSGSSDFDNVSTASIEIYNDEPQLKMNNFYDLGAAMKFENELKGGFNSDFNMGSRYCAMQEDKSMSLIEKKPA